MTGWPSKEVLGKKQHSLLHHTKINGGPYLLEEDPIHLSSKSGRVYHITDEVFWRKDGTPFPVEYISTPIWESAKMVGTVVVFSDITLRRKSEMELKESEARYRMFADNVSDVIWTMDLTGKFTYISPSIERQTGFTAEETMARKFAARYTAWRIHGFHKKNAQQQKPPVSNQTMSLVGMSGAGKLRDQASPRHKQPPLAILIQQQK